MHPVLLSLLPRLGAACLAVLLLFAVISQGLCTGHHPAATTATAMPTVVTACAATCHADAHADDDDGDPAGQPVGDGDDGDGNGHCLHCCPVLADLAGTVDLPGTSALLTHLPPTAALPMRLGVVARQPERPPQPIV